MASVEFRFWLHINRISGGFIGMWSKYIRKNITLPLSLISPKAISLSICQAKLLFICIENIVGFVQGLRSATEMFLLQYLSLVMHAMDLIYLMECETFESNCIRKYLFDFQSI